MRSIWCTSDIARIDFPYVYQAFCIHRETSDLAEIPVRHPETACGITSLTAWQANPAGVLAGNRGHREAENREHDVRDRTFDEDRSQVRTGASPQFLATARNIAISLLRLAGCASIARGLEYLSRRPDQVLALPGVLPERSRKEVVIKRRSLACDFAEDPAVGAEPNAGVPG